MTTPTSTGAMASASDAASFQDRVRAHLRHVCDDVGDPSDLPERRDRFGEEAMELFQSLGGTQEMAHALVSYVFGRPKGEPAQELGGVMTTLAGAATYAGLDMAECGERELARTWQPEVVAKIQWKRSNRHGRGPLPGSDADLVSSAALASPPLVVPESVRRLSEAATQGLWSVGPLRPGYAAISAEGGRPRNGDRDAPWSQLAGFVTVVEGAKSETGEANADFAVAAVNFVRALLSTPSGRANTPPARGGAVNQTATDDLVDRFAAALKAKLRASEAKYGWQNGWLRDDWAADCQHDLLRHVGKGDPLDVAAYAAFCWHHGWATAAPTAPEPAAGGERETASLDDRLRAAGMFTVSEMMGETPLTRWETHSGMADLAAFDAWLERKVAEYLRMSAGYELGDKDKGDELYEWVLAHSAAFKAIRVNFKAAARTLLSAEAQTVAGGGGWHQPDETPEIGRRYVQLSEDGSCAYLRVRYDGGTLDGVGSEAFQHPEYPSGPWAYTPPGFRFWCEDNGDDRLTLPEPAPADTGAEGGQR